MTRGFVCGMRAVLLSAAVTGMVAACAPVIRSHGYAPLDEEIAEIRVGQDTRGSVQRKIGRPGSTGIFTDEGWYYVATQIEHYTYHEPKVIDRRVVAVVFDQTDVVAAVNEYGLEDGRIVDLETKTTPTYGRQLTVLEQAFGNIGVLGDELFNQN